MGYQGGRRYGDDDRARSDWDRGSDRHRGQRDWRDDRSYRYGTRGQFSGPDSRRSPEQYDPEERGFFDRAGDEIRSWFGDEEAERRREYDEYYNRPYGDPRDESSRIGFASASRSNQYLPNRGYAPIRGNAVAMAARIMAIAYAPTAPRMIMASIMTPTIMRGDNSG